MYWACCVVSLLTRNHGVDACEYETIFNTSFSVTNSNMMTLCRNNHFSGVSIHMHIHTQVTTDRRVEGRCIKTDPLSRAYPRLIVCSTPRRVPFTYFRERLACAHVLKLIAYSLHQCGMSLLSRDGRISDCIARHRSVEHPFFLVLI